MLIKTIDDYKPAVQISAPHVGVMRVDWTPDEDMVSRVQWWTFNKAHAPASLKDAEAAFVVSGEAVLSKGLSRYDIVEGVENGNQYIARVAYMDDQGNVGSFSYAM